MPSIPAGIRLQALRELDDMLVREGKLKRNPNGSVVATEAAAAAAAAGPTWQAIGPQPATSTSASVGQVSGRVTALAVDPTNPNIVYLGGAFGGIWKTMDGGATWTPLTDGQPSIATGSIAIDPTSCSPAPCKTIYVGTGEEDFAIDSYYGAGVLKSTDGGSTWTQLGCPVGNTIPACAGLPPGSPFVGPFSTNSGSTPVTVPGARIGSLAVNPSKSNILLAGVQTITGLNAGRGSPGGPGLYCSDDGGDTWTMNSFVSGAAATSVIFASGTTAYVGLGRIFGDPENGVYKTTNADQACSAQVWTQLASAGLPAQSSMGRIQLAVAPLFPNVIYAAFGNASGGSGTLLGMFKSIDSGATWTQLTNTPDFCSSQCWYDLALAVNPTDPNTVYAGGSATANFFMRSTNGGTSWSPFQQGSNGVRLHVDQHAIALSVDGKRLYVGNDGGVWRADFTSVTDPINWTDLNGTLNITQFYPGHSIHPSNEQISFGGTQDNGTQKFTGTLNWQEVTCGDGGWTAIDPLTPTTVYAACQDIDIRKSTSDGTAGTFKLNFDSGITQGDRHAFIPPFVIDPANPQRLYFGTFRIWQTQNGASAWTAVSSDLTGGSGELTAITVAPSNSNVVYAGADTGRVSVCTTAGSATPGCWQSVNTGLPTRSVAQVTVDPSDPNTAYVAFSGFTFGSDTQGHIFKTSNSGVTWLDISGTGVGALPNTPVNDIVVDPDIANTLYVATDIGVFMTSNANAGAATTWTAVNPASPGVAGLPRVAVLSLKLHEPSRTLRAATHGRGVWDFQLASVSTFGLTSLSPTSTPAGSAGLTLTVNGNGFTQAPLSTVKWNGAAQATTFVTANQLTAIISASLLAAAGTAQVTVDQSGGGGPVSNALVFTITGPTPILDSVTPNAAAAGSGNTNIALTGSNFASAAQVNWNGSTTGITTNPGGTSTQLTAVISSSLLQFGGLNFIAVVNPPPGGGASNNASFNTIAAPPPNDNFVNAIAVTSGNFQSIVDNSRATTESSDPTPPASCSSGSGNPRGKTVWYKLTPTSSGSVTADTIGSSYDTLLSVWTGTQGSLTTVSCSDDIVLGTNQQSQTTFNVTAGTTYFLMIGPFDTTLLLPEEQGGKTVLNITTSVSFGPDFSLTAIPPSPSSVTVTAGNPANYTITIAAQNGTFSNAVLLTCSGAPLRATCGLNPTSVTPGATSMTSTLTITTTSNAAAPGSPSSNRRWPLPGAPWWILAGLVLLSMTAMKRATRRHRVAASALLLALLALMLLNISSCGGGGGGGGNNGTPRGTYTITVTGTSGATVHSVNVTLTVQ